MIPLELTTVSGRTHYVLAESIDSFEHEWCQALEGDADAVMALVALEVSDINESFGLAPSWRVGRRYRIGMNPAAVESVCAPSRGIQRAVREHLDERHEQLNDPGMEASA